MLASPYTARSLSTFCISFPWRHNGRQRCGLYRLACPGLSSCSLACARRYRGKVRNGKRGKLEPQKQKGGQEWLGSTGNMEILWGRRAWPKKVLNFYGMLSLRDFLFLCFSLENEYKKYALVKKKKSLSQRQLDRKHRLLTPKLCRGVL